MPQSMSRELVKTICLLLQEKICEDSASFDLTSFDLASCIEDINQCLEFVLSKEGHLDIDDGAGEDHLIHCVNEEGTLLHACRQFPH